MLKDVLVIMSTSTTCLGLRASGKSTYSVSTLRKAVQSAWPVFINSIGIDADEHVQGQISNLHAQIDELKDTLHDAKKSYHNTEAALMKEHSCVKDLEQELKDLKSHLQSEANTSVL